MFRFLDKKHAPQVHDMMRGVCFKMWLRISLTLEWCDVHIIRLYTNKIALKFT